MFVGCSIRTTQNSNVFIEANVSVVARRYFVNGASPVMEVVYNWFLMATVGKTFWGFVAEMAIPVFSVGGVWLSTSHDPHIRKIGFGCGIVSQPFWFYAAITAINLGMLINAVFFTALWVWRFTFVKTRDK